MTLRFGDYIELAIWLSGDETAEHIRSFMDTDAKEALNAKANKERVALADPEFTIKKPGEDRVPAVPKWLEQRCISNGRKVITITWEAGKEPEKHQAPVMLVARAMVTGRKQSVKKRGFLADLGIEDLKRLRVRTREVWDKSGVGYRTLTDAECDKIIDEHGPDAAAKAVMGTLHSGTRH